MTEDTDTVQQDDNAELVNDQPEPVAVREFIGTKLVAGVPMTRGEYNESRGWTPPEGEDQTVEGYQVTYYPDGYVSWSPKDVFEEAYSEVASGLNGPDLLETVRRKTGILNVTPNVHG